MKVALILATDGSNCEDAVLAPFRSATFLDGLRGAGLAPTVVAVVSESAATTPEQASPEPRRCRRSELASLLASEQVQVVQTFGPEDRLSEIWPIAAAAGLPIIHCVSCGRENASAASHSSRISSLAASRAKRASRQVAALVGTGRAAVGKLIEEGYFPNAAFSVIVAPPVVRGSAAPTTPSQRRSDPVFGVYDPCASSDVVAFVARAVDLTGRRNAPNVRLAAGAPFPQAPGSISIVPAEGVDGFLAAIDVLAVPAYDDGLADPLIAALRAGKPVIVPDPSGAAELIEYGRHGLLFSADSAYHFANALELLGQSWSERPVLLADGGPAIARTEPAAVSQSFAAVYRRLAAEPRAALRTSSHG